MLRSSFTLRLCRRSWNHVPRLSATSCNGLTSLLTQKRAATISPSGDDDFVDLLFPGTNDSPPTLDPNQSELATEENLAPLGVQRDEVLEDNQLRTRLGRIAIRSDADVRQGTRAAELQDKKGSQTDLAKNEAEEEVPEWEGTGDQEQFNDDGTLRGIDLPYDDEKFAETILKMEVDGQLDESWQNSRQAKVEDCQAIADILRHMKARDLCVIDVSQKTSSFDYIIMATCEGPRHVHLCSWSITQADRDKRLSKPKRAASDRNWEIVPVGRIIVNLMVESARTQLSLERKWAVTKTMDPLDHANATISEGRAVKAHGLWTLTLNLQDLEDFEVDYCKDALLAQL